ncbi:condensation domain-containing protein [Streptomyces sp. NPDC058052]|uniref:condensation domain-containing protein n=1 Tax=Streptomyces sp. NPDC058052 TaxID=3346316 RepID=UPI0036EB3536
MRITDIQRADLRPGRLVEWTLSPATVAAAAARSEDARPPAYIQETHLRRARTVRGEGLVVPTWIGVGFDLAGPVDVDVLQEALLTWTRRHETLRSGFRWAGASGDELHRFTLDAGDMALHREEIGDFPDADHLAQRLQDRFDEVADALVWPNLIYTAVLRDDSASVYLAFDHSNVDAYSLFRIPADLRELYEAGPAAEEIEEPAPVASYVDFCERERADADLVDGGHDSVARWREFIRRCGGRLPGFPVELGLTPDSPPARQLMLCEPLADAAEAAAFEAYCRPYGGSMAGVLAATALIVHELSGEDVYRTVVPFHTRGNSRWADSVGWYVGGAPIEVPVGRSPDFADVLREVRGELLAHRSLARLPLSRVLALLDDTQRPSSPDLCSLVSFVDTRFFPGAEKWQEQRARGLMRVSYSDHVYVWVNRLHEGLWLATRHPDTEAAAKAMRIYAERLRSYITGVTAG